MRGGDNWRAPTDKRQRRAARAGDRGARLGFGSEQEEQAAGDDPGLMQAGSVSCSDQCARAVSGLFPGQAAHAADARNTPRLAAIAPARGCEPAWQVRGLASPSLVPPHAPQAFDAVAVPQARSRTGGSGIDPGRDRRGTPAHQTHAVRALPRFHGQAAASGSGLAGRKAAQGCYAGRQGKTEAQSADLARSGGRKSEAIDAQFCAGRAPATGPGQTWHRRRPC